MLLLSLAERIPDSICSGPRTPRPPCGATTDAPAHLHLPTDPAATARAARADVWSETGTRETTGLTTGGGGAVRLCRGGEARAPNAVAMTVNANVSVQGRRLLLMMSGRKKTSRRRLLHMTVDLFLFFPRTLFLFVLLTTCFFVPPKEALCFGARFSFMYTVFDSFNDKRVDCNLAGVEV